MKNILNWIILWGKYMLYQIQFDSSNSIITSSVNSGDFSIYTFLFTPDFDIVNPCYLEIKFPELPYLSGLGLDFQPEITFKPENIVLASPSQITSRTVKIFPSILRANNKIELKIKNIKNPDRKGGSGNFVMKVQCVGEESLTNQLIDTVGIHKNKDKIRFASIDFLEGSSKKAGEKTSLILTFETENTLPHYISAILTIPNDIDLKETIIFHKLTENKNICQFLERKDEITCNFNDNNELVISGFTSGYINRFDKRNNL